MVDRIRRPSFLAFALAIFALVCSANLASAETTHPYLGTFDIASGSKPQPIAVDGAGNLIVWLESEGAVAKFDPSGNPVDFSGLGTHILDGKGGFDCPKTPADCDRVPSGGFLVFESRLRDPPVAVDTSDGPGAGQIYIANSVEPEVGQVEIFDPTGKYVGKVDQAQATPLASPIASTCDISTAPNGTLFIVHRQGCGDSHIDAYAPTLADPGDPDFVGQIRSPFGNSFTESDLYYAMGDDAYVYAHSDGGGVFSSWRKFPISELGRPTGNSIPIDFSPDQSKRGNESGPFGDGGIEGECCWIETGGIDPLTHYVYLFTPLSGIEIWDSQNNKIGPNFGKDQYSGRTLAFDRSGGPNDGRIYIKGVGSDQAIAVFGAPVVIPDVVYGAVEVGHDAAHIEANVDPAGGGPVTNCYVEYGLTDAYGQSEPCDQSSGDVSFDLSGLLTEATYHYRVVASNANGVNPGGDRTFRPTAVLDVQTDPATDVGRNSATLNGKLDPDGMATSYHFEYGIDTTFRESTVTEDAGSGTGQVALPPIEIENLQPGRTYHYRLVAENALGTTFGQGRTLTAASPPEISSVRATDVTETSAILRARINPFASETTYRFEYGTTTSYGESVPVPVGNVGSGLSDEPVSATIEGLQSGVTYHFRLVATNAWGTSASENTTFTFFPPTCPNAHVRQQSSSSYLPDCRAYEIVSPGNAGSVSLFPGGISDTLGDGLSNTPFRQPFFKMEAANATGLATNPPRFGFIGAVGRVKGTEPPNALLDRYVATRTLGGWITTYPGAKGSEALLQGRPRCSIQLDVCLEYKIGDFQNGSLPDGKPYTWDVSGRSLGRWPTNLAIVPGSADYAIGLDPPGDDEPSGDFSHYAFSAREIAFAPGGQLKAPGSVYDNDIEEREVNTASILPNGDPIPQDVGKFDEVMNIPAVSIDGSHILMSTLGPTNTTNLYMRVNGSITYEISQGVGVRFVAMSRSGSTVVFTSSEQITSDDTDFSIDMFMWDESTGGVTRVSQGNGNGDGDECNAGWTAECNVTAISPDRLDLDNLIAPGTGEPYFYSPEQLDPDNPGIKNERNLYVFRNGKVQYVTTLDTGTAIDRIQISPDNSKAAFVTAARLTGYDSEGWRQMYTYDAESGVIRCVSCLPSGEPPQILHSEPPGNDLNKTGNVLASLSGPFMSDDGRVAFTTSDALVPRDTNRLMDVYEFVEGRAQLISAGTGQRDFYPGAAFFPPLYTGLESFSADGVDLYFSTYDTLASEDINGSFIKFYDARTNGGFPDPAPILPCVAADECRGTGSGRPGELQLGTTANLGTGGNQVAESRKAKRDTRAKRQRKKQRAGHRKGKKRARTARRQAR